MHTNALIDEKSPYLRQHAHNPVDWLPWGDRAFDKALVEDKPIFLSIGYSTCHWCHVMAHESFEDDRVAEILNRDFVPVKLDREERPDVDRVYMLFVQASTGSGGWPMSVWLTPELRPFFGGTYFPPDSRYGRPGFLDLLRHLSEAWRKERSRIEASSSTVIDQLRGLADSNKETGDKQAVPLDKELFDSGFWQFRRMFDSRWGGFGRAPKFPRPAVFNYLLRYYAESNNSEAVEMVSQTLTAMAQGGMHDHLGGGFHRYSVDERWFVPHFEKMLYDQAQLATAYLEAYQVTGEELFAEVARGVFTYVMRDMTDAAGGFFSAEDADSPDPDDPDHSREGAFYVWTEAEIESVLGLEEARRFADRYGLKPDGNVDDDPHGEFIGRNILYKPNPDSGKAGSLQGSGERLLRERSKRPRPHLDGKVLTSWNGLMITAFIKGFVVLGDEIYLATAERAMAFLLSKMYDERTGQVLRRYLEGDSAIPGFLDDYAFFAQAVLDLFEATGTADYLTSAIRVVRTAVGQFEDTVEGGFFSTGANSPDVVLRIKDDYDGAEPSGNSVVTDVLLRLSHLTGELEFQRLGERSLRAFAPKLKAGPTVAPQMLVALGRFLSRPEQVVIRCERSSTEAKDLLAAERRAFRPWSAVFPLTDAGAAELRIVAPFLSSLERRGRLTVYACHDFACDLPQVIE